MTEFANGDKVTWKVHSGEAVGTVQSKITTNAKVAGHRVRATEGGPQYVVRDQRDGSATAHKASALRHAE